MTGKHRQHDEERLARLYREQGDIEPGSGVDQRILTRARDKVRPGRLPRPAHWLGGAAVAASLLVAVSIVINLEPPQPEWPPGELERQAEPARDEAGDRTESSAFSAARSRGSQEVPAAEPAMDQIMQSFSRPPEEATADHRPAESVAEEVGRTAREQYESLGASRPPGQSLEEARDLLPPVGEVESGLLDDESAEANRVLWLIDRLITVGNVQRARVEIDRFTTRFPEREIPPELLAELERQESPAPAGTISP